MQLFLIIVLSISLLLQLIFANCRYFTGVTCLFLLTVGGLYFWGPQSIVSWVFGNLAFLAYLSLAYFVVGFIFTIIKYTYFLKGIARNTNPSALKSELEKYSPSRMSGDIAGWIVWWPFALSGSAISFLLKDFMEFLYKKIYSIFQGTFTRIYNRYVKNDIPNS